MPEYRRADIPGATYFFTVITYRRQALLTDPRCRESLRNAIEKGRLEMPFDIVAWVLMPNPLHAVWQLPQHDKDFSLRWSLINPDNPLENKTSFRRRPESSRQNDSAKWTKPRCCPTC